MKQIFPLMLLAVLTVAHGRLVMNYRDIFKRLLQKREANNVQRNVFRDDMSGYEKQKFHDQDLDYDNDSNEIENFRARKREKIMNLLSEIEDYERHKRKEKIMNLLSGIEDYERNKRGDKETTSNHVPEPEAGKMKKHKLKMPNVAPEKPDTYLCYAYELPKEDVYITKFEPDADMRIAHHMLLFGCVVPYRKGEVWPCQEMKPVCSSGSQAIKYAWGKNAPSLEMPDGVAFHVGGSAPIKYLVLQVHYLNVDTFKDGKKKDRSGLIFTTTTRKPKFFAGIQLLGAGWPPIPPHKERFHMDMNCLYQNNNGMKFYPFRFRVHAHKLGLVITAYRVRDGKATLIGRGDPQRAQAFYKVKQDVNVQDDDLLIGRCTYNSSSRVKNTYIGATHLDEMCNFYIMYFYDNKFGDVDQLPCYPSNKKVVYPPDSDVSLAEVERENSLEIHNKLLEKKLTETLKICKDNDIFTYRTIENWPSGGKTTGDLPINKKLPQLGQIAGVAATFKHVIIFHRVDREWDATTFDMSNDVKEEYKKPIKGDTLVWLDRKSGEFVKSAGANIFSLPHGITVDHEGNLWLTDVGSHQVIKMSADGKVLKEFGKKYENGKSVENFCKPTDVVIMKNGDFFVADGYCNNRVLKFNADGKVLMNINSKYTKTLQPPHMTVVHSLAYDEKDNRLLVADRQNNRILLFHAMTGNYLSQIKLSQPVYAIAYEKTCGGVVHAVTQDYEGGKALGYTFSVHSSEPVGKWKPSTGFNKPHDLAVSPDQRQIFVSEIGPNRIWKFTNGRVRP